MNTRTCQWCNQIMKQPNFKKHLSKCFFKNDLEATREEITHLLQNKRGREDEDKYEMLQVFFKKVENQVTKYREILGKVDKDPQCMIEDLSLEDSTKRVYKSEWKKFSQFAEKNKLPHNAESANTYLGRIKCAISTKYTKRNMLQNILRNLFDNEQLKLKPIRQKYSAKSKHTFTHEELGLYLEEQKELDTELYVAQLLMATYGLRVSSIAALQKKHLDFLYNNFNRITLPDPKGKTQRSEDLDNHVKNELMNYMEEFELAELDDDDFLFLRQSNNSTLNQRASYLCRAINKRLVDTKAILKSPNEKYTSHLFRKTLANREYQTKLEELKKEARGRIGHAISSNAIERYLDN
jgi:integrase